MWCPSDDGIDWEQTLAFRRHLWSYGLGVAEAMDTAQRGMGLPWEAARELIARSLAEAKPCGGPIACGAGTDQLPDGLRAPLDRDCRGVRRAVRMGRESRRARDPDGQPRAGAQRRIRRTITWPCIRASSRNCASRRFCTGWEKCSIRNSPATGVRRTLDRAMETCLGLIRDHARAVGWHQDFSARCPARNRDAAQAARRRSHVYRRRFQLRRADPRRRRASQRRAAGDFRRDRSGRVGRDSSISTPGCVGRIRSHPRAHRSAVAAHFRSADVSYIRPESCFWPG